MRPLPARHVPVSCDGDAAREVTTVTPASRTHPQRNVMHSSAIAKLLRQARAVTAISAVLAAACAGPEAKLGVSVNAHGAYAEASRYHVTITQGPLNRVIDGQTLHVSAQAPGYLAAGREGIRLSAGEPATVNIIVETSTGTAAGSASWTPQENWEYGVAAFVDTHRPAGFCFKIVEAIPLPAPAAAAVDTLYILQSGLPKGAVC